MVLCQDTDRDTYQDTMPQYPYTCQDIVALCQETCQYTVPQCQGTCLGTCQDTVAQCQDTCQYPVPRHVLRHDWDTYLLKKAHVA